MQFRSLAAVVVLSSTHALAKVPACDPQSMDCSPLVVCVEATGEIMRGASFGRDEGPFATESSDGVLCEGTWRRGFMGVGLASFTCNDGRSGKSAFTWFEPESGTAVGTGTFSDGQEARFWGGNNLERYFREISPQDRQAMTCTPEDMLLS